MCPPLMIILKEVFFLLATVNTFTMTSRFQISTVVLNFLCDETEQLISTFIRNPHLFDLQPAADVMIQVLVAG